MESNLDGVFVVENNVHATENAASEYNYQIVDSIFWHQIVTSLLHVIDF